MAGENNSARIENILGQIRELKKQYERRAAVTGEGFNVFEILGVERREMKHSAMLANLLNPKGSHRQGAVFLEHFLNLEPLRLADSFGYGKLDDFQVVSEVATNANDGRIDIRLQKKGYTCIIIENKVDAEDGDGQLNKYYRDAKEEGFTDEQIKLIYLTLYGEPPSERSLAGQELLDADSVICISYESHILRWLEDCFKKVAKVAPIREVLFQYQVLIKKLTGLPTKEDFFKNKIREILTDNYDLLPELKDSILTDNYDLLPELKDFIPKIEEAIQDKFWKRLEEKITEVCHIKRCDSVKTEIIFKIPRGELCPPFEIGLRIKLEKEFGVCYGFVLLENGSRVEKCNQKEFEEYATLVHKVLNLQKGQGGPSSGMLGWKYPKYQNRVILFSDVERMRNVIEDDRLAKLVGTIAQEIEDAVDKFIEAKKDAGL